MSVKCKKTKYGPKHKTVAHPHSLDENSTVDTSVLAPFNNSQQWAVTMNVMLESHVNDILHVTLKVNKFPSLWKCLV